MSIRFLSLVFALSLLAGGWSYALAAALCPQACCITSNAMEEHTRPASDDAAAAEHCSAGMDRSEHHQSHAVAAGDETGWSGTETFQIINQRAPSCTHCMCAPTAPVATVSVNAPEPLRRDAEFLAARNLKACVLPEFAASSSRTPSQKPPPGSVQSKFLLTHSFLI